MHRNITMILTLLFIFIIPISIICQQSAEKINDEIVLEIPPVKITQYEYEKNLREFLTLYRQTNGKDPTEEEIKVWKNEFIDRTYLLAELYDKGYNKRTDVEDAVNSMANIILTQDQGLVYNKIIGEKIIVTDDEIKDVYERGNKQFKIECLTFPDKNTPDSIWETQYQNIKEKDFDSLVVLSKIEKSIIHNFQDVVWPYIFVGSLRKQIINSDIGDIIYVSDEPEKNISIYRVKKIKNIELKPYNEVKENIRIFLTKAKEIDLQKEFNSKILRYAHVKINDTICNRFVKLFRIDPFKITDTTSKFHRIYEQFNPIYYDTLAWYNMKGKNQPLLVNGFLDNYTRRIIMPIFTNKSHLVKFITEFVKEEYLLALADSLDLKSEKKFILDRINYKNKTMLRLYETRELSKQANVENKEIVKEYEKNKTDFKTAETANVFVYTFKSKDEAIAGNYKKNREPIKINLRVY